MKPPYQRTSKIMSLVVAISETIGQINAMHLYKPTTELRKKNRIKTIKFSLEIEGNSLTEEQVTALIDNKRIIAPVKDYLVHFKNISAPTASRNLKFATT
jgi:Fic family protein